MLSRAGEYINLELLPPDLTPRLQSRKSKAKKWEYLYMDNNENEKNI